MRHGRTRYYLEDEQGIGVDQCFSEIARKVYNSDKAYQHIEPAHINPPNGVSPLYVLHTDNSRRHTQILSAFSYFAAQLRTHC